MRGLPRATPGRHLPAERICRRGVSEHRAHQGRPRQDALRSGLCNSLTAAAAAASGCTLRVASGAHDGGSSALPLLRVPARADWGLGLGLGLGGWVPACQVAWLPVGPAACCAAGQQACEPPSPPSPDGVQHKVGQPVRLQSGGLGALVQRGRARHPRKAVLAHRACGRAGTVRHGGFGGLRMACTGQACTGKACTRQARHLAGCRVGQAGQATRAARRWRPTWEHGPQLRQRHVGQRQPARQHQRRHVGTAARARDADADAAALRKLLLLQLAVHVVRSEAGAAGQRAARAWPRP